jgi:hypothetical protein
VKRYNQSYEEIADSLRVLEVDWMSDPHADAVISLLKALPTQSLVKEEDVIGMLTTDFRAASTVLRLFLGMAKDEYDREVLRIVQQRRDDTAFLLVTDGVSWRSRQSDLRKIIKLQNEGKIRRIYTMAMEAEMRADLIDLKNAARL